MILDLQHIFKDYNQDKLVVPVLKDVNLQVEEGEYVAIMGPSGALTVLRQAPLIWREPTSWP